MYLNYFIGQEYGPDCCRRFRDRVVDLSLKRRALDEVITDCFEQVVYSINQPTGARNFQAVFWNIAYYDRYYFESLFGNFFFPDGSRPGLGFARLAAAPLHALVQRPADQSGAQPFRQRRWPCCPKTAT